jgi:hypothetical protein
MNHATTDKSRGTAGFLSGVALAVLVGLASPPAAPGAAGQTSTATSPPQEISVPLKEIPVWELANEQVRGSFLRGQYAPVQMRTLGPVKYPEFTSDAPRYGQVRFQDADPDTYRPGGFHFALDCSQKGGNYDRLYFDENADGDLTNDKPRRPAPQSQQLARRGPSARETFFEPVSVTFRMGPAGQRTVELLPCLRVYSDNIFQFSFIAARVYTGTFQIDGASYEATLGCQYMIQGSLDHPSTTLILAPSGGPPVMWSGGDQLRTTHRLGGHYYRFASTPAGDKLTVRPYEGPLGVFEIGPGGRKVRTLTMSGALGSATTTVAVHAETFDSVMPMPTRSCRLPAGDYRINSLSVQMDGLRALVLNNYHADGKPMGRAQGRDTYGIAVREDKPFVLEFSPQPQVLFALPPRDQSVALGQELSIKAVLIDPALDVMFRVITAERQLDPKVVIKRANGEIVAEGTMPFG